MFKFEKDMIPVLEKGLSDIYKTDHILSEFNSGHGIADLVLGLSIKEWKELLLDYENIYWVLKYINRRNKIVDLNKIVKTSTLKKGKLSWIFSLLVQNGILEKVSDNTFLILDKYSPPVEKIVSIEAKLSDWKWWLIQALRYKLYSHQSYLAISKEFSHRVDIKLLKEYNIWLIEVDLEGIKIIFRPKNEIPGNKTAYSYLSEKFYHTINNAY